jgi:hypothetical protein
MDKIVSLLRIIEKQGFFLLKVRKFAKMTFLGAGFIRFAHPA